MLIVRVQCVTSHMSPHGSYFQSRASYLKFRVRVCVRVHGSFFQSVTDCYLRLFGDEL